MYKISLPPLRVIMLAPLAFGNGCHCVRLQNNATADSAVLLVDGRMSGACVNDYVFRVVDGPVNIGRYNSPGTCNTEIVVFSDGDAVQVVDPTSTFSSMFGTETVDLTPDLINVTVVVWRADGLTGAVAPASTELALANTLFDDNNSGISLTPTYQTVNSADSTTINDAAIDTWNTLSCASAAPVSGDPNIYTAGQINVYYTTQAFTGWYCGSSQIIMIGTIAQPESLTHEFGHAFSLDHTNNVDYDGDGVVDFPATNIMIGGGFGRDTYSEGQAFRMSLNSSSDLNGLGYRTGSTRTCTDATISATCPWLALDATPN